MKQPPSESVSNDTKFLFLIATNQTRSSEERYCFAIRTLNCPNNSASDSLLETVDARFASSITIYGTFIFCHLPPFRPLITTSRYQLREKQEEIPRAPFPSTMPITKSNIPERYPTFGICSAETSFSESHASLFK
jgi:hypothetical protein